MVSSCPAPPSELLWGLSCVDPLPFDFHPPHRPSPTWDGSIGIRCWDPQTGTADTFGSFSFTMAAPPFDVEKSAEATNRACSSSEIRTYSAEGVNLHAPSGLRELNARIESLSGFEARGITRVLPEERQPPSAWDDVAVALLWFSANLSVNNLAVGLFGPLLFGLGFLDSALCAVFGGLLGSLSTAYMSTWGPRSGNRTMVRLRRVSYIGFLR